MIIKHTFKRALIIHYTLKRRWADRKTKKMLTRHCIMETSTKTPTEANRTQGGYSARWILPLSILYCIILIGHLAIDPWQTAEMIEIH